MRNDDRFFLPGKAVDPSYTNVRDSEPLSFARDFTESLWPTYRPFADPNARSNAKSQFLQRFWEMYLACTLLDRGFKLERVGHEGPEFYFVCEGRRIWVEAIAPCPGNGADSAPRIQLGVAYTVPSEQILMRFTHALREKHRKYEQALSKGIVKPEDHLVLAINSRGIPHAPYGAEISYVLKAFLPFGALTYVVDRETLELRDSHYQLREKLLKANGEPVATTAFLDPKFSAFSAILHSGVDCANHPTRLGDDFMVVHNPTATYNLPHGLFSWCQQFELHENTLHEFRKNMPKQPVPRDRLGRRTGALEQGTRS
jgi:hypothetical protein